MDRGALYAGAPDARVRGRALDEQVRDPAVVLLVAAVLALQHEREGRVLIDQDPGERVHHVEQAEHVGGC